MRVLFVAPQPFFTERGTPIAVRMLLETLGALGHEIDVLTYHEGEDVEIAGVTIIRISRPPGVRNVPIGPSWKKIVCDLWLAASFFKRARPGRYDVIHAIEESAMLAAVLRWFHRTPFVVDMDSSIPDQLQEKYAWVGPILWLPRLLERSAVRKGIATMAVCDALADVARAAEPGGPVHVVTDVALEYPDPGSDVVPLRAALSIPESTPLILYVGNLQSYQGIDLLLDAFRRVRSPAALVVVGGDEESIAAYRAAAADLEGRVFWAGPRPIPQLTWLLKQADVLVSPRLKGANTPMKVYSYLASGVPMIATSIASHTQVLDETTSILSAPQPEAFAQGLERLLNDAPLRAKLGAAALGVAERDYSRAVFDERVGRFYAEVEEAVQRQGGTP